MKPQNQLIRCPNCSAWLEMEEEGRVPHHRRMVRAGFVGLRPVRCAGTGRQLTARVKKAGS